MLAEHAKLRLEIMHTTAVSLNSARTPKNIKSKISSS
jgi:hypothetical protein